MLKRVTALTDAYKGEGSCTFMPNFVLDLLDGGVDVVRGLQSDIYGKVDAVGSKDAVDCSFQPGDLTAAMFGASIERLFVSEALQLLT
jgi:hypothetical protein